MAVNIRCTACSRGEPDHVEMARACISCLRGSVTDSSVNSMEMGGSTRFCALSRQRARPFAPCGLAWERRISARRGWASEMCDCLNILRLQKTDESNFQDKGSNSVTSRVL